MLERTNNISAATTEHRLIVDAEHKLLSTLHRERKLTAVSGYGDSLKPVRPKCLDKSLITTLTGPSETEARVSFARFLFHLDFDMSVWNDNILIYSLTCRCLV